MDRDDRPRRPYDRDRTSTPPRRTDRDDRPRRPYDRDRTSTPPRRTDRDDRPRRPYDRDRTTPPPRRTSSPVAKKWGGVARRGAQNLADGAESGPSASELWRAAVARADQTDEPWTPDEVWIEEEEPEQAPAPARSPQRAQPRDLATGKEGVPSPGGHRRKVPRPVLSELEGAAGAARGAKLAHRIADATYAYERERYQEARRILKSLSEEVPESAAVRELYGLVLYRTGQWSAAAKQLEALRTMTGSFDQYPVLADCYRALGRYDQALAVWEELREASPSGDLVAEGRIVAAGARADQGDLQGAIGLLERSLRKVKAPKERHLRQWYALADLYERAGDVPRARDLFNRVASFDPNAFDVRGRLRALR